MENNANPSTDQLAGSPPQGRRPVRKRLLWVVTGFCLLALVSFFAWQMSESRALAIARAQAVAAGQPLQNSIVPPIDARYGQAQPVYFPKPNGVPYSASAPSTFYPSTFNGQQLSSYQNAQLYPSSSPTPFIGSNTYDAHESQLESRIQQIALQYRSAELGKKESMSQALTHFLTELFDARQKAQSSRVEALKAEVQQTQELLDKRLQNKSKIIERRVKELTGQQDELSWNASVPVANPSSPRYENNPLQPPIQTSAYDARTNSTVPMAGTLHQAPSYPIPSTTPSDNYPSSSPVSFPPTSPVIDNALSQTIRASDLNVDESLPTPSANPNPTPTSLPFNASPSSNNPVNAPLELGPPSNSPASNNPASITLESQRSFMNIGFKLKGLMRQLEGEQSIKGATKVKSEIEETKAVWEFEKSSLESELESAESEYQLVTKQLVQAIQQVDIQQARVNAGTSADAQLNFSKAEVSKSEVERQLLQLRSRMTTIKKSIDWMENFFKEKPISPPSAVAVPEASPLVGS